MTRPRWIALFVLLGSTAYFLSACSVPEETVEVVEPQPLATQELEPEQIVANWLECEDCSDGEFQAVVELGEEAVPLLLEILEAGPPPEVLKEAEDSLISSYREVAEYAEKHPELEMEIPQTEEEYVFFYVGNIYVQYAQRSIVALVEIEGTEVLGEAAELLRTTLEFISPIGREEILSDELFERGVPGREDLIDVIVGTLEDLLRESQ